MGWFRRKKPKEAHLPLASAEPVERWKQRLVDAGLEFVSIKSLDTGTYQTLSGQASERAKAFLRNEPIDKEFYYIVVETPDGNWGSDINGLYLENLRPWQLNTAEAHCAGTITALIDGNQSIEWAARGLADNWVAEVTCGHCGREWIDGLRYRDVTLVRCPGCSAANTVDSSGFSFASA